MNTLEITEPARPTTLGNDVVLLPYGLLGFEPVKKYRLLTRPEEAPFLWFQMLEGTRQSFLVLPPGVAVSNYQPDLDEQDARFLELEDPADALVLNIVTLHGGGPATINLKGPIVINRRTWIGKQVIPANAARYPVRHPLPLS